MRIGVEARYLLAKEKTGVEQYTAGLVRALLALDSAHEFFLYVDAASPIPELQGARAQSRLVPRRRLWLKLWLPLAAKRDGVQVMLYPGSIVSTFHPFRCVSIFHDLCWAYYPQFYPPREQAIYARALPKSLARTGAVLTPSQQTKRDLVATYKYPQERITVIPAGRDPAFQPEPDAPQVVKRKFDLEPGYILAVGTSHPRKNVATLIQAYAQLVRRGFSAPLVLVGPGETTRLKAVAREAGLSDEVRWLGYVAKQDMPALYTACGVFVFPSFFEGFGLPALEAMGCGAPVVCARGGALPEVVGEAAVLVDPAAIEAWVEALANVLSQPELAKELSARGQAQVRLFDWTESARLALAALERV